VEIDGWQHVGGAIGLAVNDAPPTLGTQLRVAVASL